MILSERRQPLYEIFIGSLESHLGGACVSEDKTSPGSSNSATQDEPDADRKIAPPQLFTENITQQMQVKGVRDPLLKLNFENIFTTELPAMSCQSETDQALDRLVLRNTDIATMAVYM